MQVELKRPKPSSRPWGFSSTDSAVRILVFQIQHLIRFLSYIVIQVLGWIFEDSRIQRDTSGYDDNDDNVYSYDSWIFWMYLKMSNYVFLNWTKPGGQLLAQPKKLRRISLYVSKKIGKTHHISSPIIRLGKDGEIGYLSHINWCRIFSVSSVSINGGHYYQAGWHHLAPR